MNSARGQAPRQKSSLTSHPRVFRVGLFAKSLYNERSAGPSIGKSLRERIRLFEFSARLTRSFLLLSPALPSVFCNFLVATTAQNRLLSLSLSRSPSLSHSLSFPFSTPIYDLNFNLRLRVIYDSCGERDARMTYLATAGNRRKSWITFRMVRC